MARIAVIDVETTGFCAARSDRIVEIAIVVLDERDGIVSEFVSLINPDRDVGPTRVHGITSSMVRNAPRFGDILGAISATLRGAVAIAGHNIKFDLSFITVEFARCGQAFPDIPSICTMQLAGGGTLESVCFDYDVSRPAIAHSALCDARATAMVLQRILDTSHELSSFFQTLPTPEWPISPGGDIPPLSRQNAEHESGPARSYIQNLARRVHGIEISEPSHDPSPQIAYAALLARAMQDRFIDDEESAALIGLADTWGLKVADITSIHHQFLAQLQVAALADGVMEVPRRTHSTRR
jgi:DNA polymerase III epsilon subunit-like protein